MSASVQHLSHHHICLCALWSSFANLHSDPTQIPTALILGLNFNVNPLRALATCLEFHFSSRWWGWRAGHRPSKPHFDYTGQHVILQILVPN